MITPMSRSWVYLHGNHHPTVQQPQYAEGEPAQDSQAQASTVQEQSIDCGSYFCRVDGVTAVLIGLAITLFIGLMTLLALRIIWKVLK